MKKILTASLITLALIGTSTVTQAASAAQKNKVTATKVSAAKNSDRAAAKQAARKAVRAEARAVAKANGVTDKASVKTAAQAAAKAAAAAIKK
jgi:hypothetical protein